VRLCAKIQADCCKDHVAGVYILSIPQQMETLVVVFSEVRIRFVHASWQLWQPIRGRGMASLLFMRALVSYSVRNQFGSQACFSFHSTGVYKQKALDLLYVYSEEVKVTTLMEMIWLQFTLALYM